MPNPPLTELQRSAGVQLHITSLPGGRLGPAALAFVDWLADAGVGWWQVLPLGPPDEHRSPYKAASAFAAWDGLLGEPDAPVGTAEVDAFRHDNAWAQGWEAFGGGDLADQVRFDREWGALRTYAAARGVKLIGDVPIYVAPGSADHLAHPELFRDDAVAGVPPDAFTRRRPALGQPALRLAGAARRGYRWWIARFRAQLRALRPRPDRPLPRASPPTGRCPADAETAAEGHWIARPRSRAVRAARARAGRACR